ncbi:diguanylate cyclase [Klebsiella pneumoniae]|uniref:GGDEF domain-containing protein n=1 Tax=Klebsiella pneumoniae TaxID=573 RepID=UPI0009427869|nr:diguanylate cyclase [Klebsiella pneumoniae]
MKTQPATGETYPKSDLFNKAIAERIRSVIESTVFTNDLRVTISAGVATQTDPLSGIDFLLKNADDALYQAKGEGRNKVIVYSAI